MFGLLKSGLRKIRGAFAKTRSILGDKIRKAFQTPLDEERLEELEQILFEADLGSKLAELGVTRMRKFSKAHPNASPQELIDEMKVFAHEILTAPPKHKTKSIASSPHVILIVGVNGSGKTTSAAKLGHLYQKEKKKILFSASDTFRAAAIEQLGLWAEKLQIPCVKGSPGGDPSAVIFDALTAAKSRDVDVVIADTAGRLQSKKDLMEELSKMNRTCGKVIADAPHDTFLVIDASLGQNGVDQAKAFHATAPLTGLILTKLDGTAKGGVILSIYHELGIPIRYIGIGEKLDDLIPFDGDSYLDALFN